MIIILAYCDTPLDATALYNVDFSVVKPIGAVGEQMSFDALKYLPSVETEVISGKTKRGRNFEHVIATSDIFDIIISADELISSVKREFVVNFWKSSHKYFLTDTEGTYINVITGGGILPIEYINESKYLPEIKLSLKVANGNGIS